MCVCVRDFLFVCLFVCLCVCLCVGVFVSVCVLPPLRGQHGEHVGLGVAEDPQQLWVRGQVGQQTQLHLAEI